MIRVRVSYTGRVQGVGFRATTRDVAAGFNITGWVRNEPDGSVSLEAQGAPSVVEQFLEANRDRLSRNIRTESRHDLAPIAHELPAFTIER
ncbi:MAG: acylphosphatase [Phycisphaerales bacterium]